MAACSYGAARSAISFHGPLRWRADTHASHPINIEEKIRWPKITAPPAQLISHTPDKIGSKKVVDVKGVKKIKKGIVLKKLRGKIAAPPGALHH